MRTTDSIKVEQVAVALDHVTLLDIWQLIQWIKSFFQGQYGMFPPWRKCDHALYSGELRAYFLPLGGIRNITDLNDGLV